MVYSQQNDREYLGTGWAFPLQLSLQGGIQLSSEAQKVRESIWIILRTGVGERVYRPNFGSRLSELAFAPINTDTLLRMRIYVLEALEVWEPRIIVDEVIIEPNPVKGQQRMIDDKRLTQADPVKGIVTIDILYRLKGYADVHSFVYPFYLLDAGE